MTRQILNNGTTANDGTGDTLRQAADKINDNFRELFLLFGDSVAATPYVRFDSSGNQSGALIFENGTYDTKLVSVATSGSSKTITFPNATGTVVLKDTTDTLTNKTLTAPIISTISDSNGDTILSLNANDSANYVEISSGDSSVGVTIGVAGDSGDVDLHLHPLNNGIIHADSRIVHETERLDSAGASVADPKILTTFCNVNDGSAEFSVSLSGGISDGDEKRFVNINATTVEVTPGSFSGGTSIRISQDRACSLIWSETGSSWRLLGATDSGGIEIV